MTDTVKIPRPHFKRRKAGLTGRVEHDARGNAVWVRTRADDTAELPETSALEIVDEKPARRAASPVRRTPKSRPLR